ncbi:MAG: Mrp/NBP35 family ATP-binding protein [Erysipelotrichaceae bacterium]|nr:Mrp/NBP35 family ATP-binding protein [Erysipelotrichaceae bacterium]
MLKQFEAELNKNSKINKVIGVVSGKGGVGKSSLTSLLAVQKQREGYKVGILDGDITGASIATTFGLGHEQVYSSNEEIFPPESENGIKVMSMHLLLENPEDPVIWRGPILADIIKQFYRDVHWGELDYLFVDMPPGTGDVPLTIFQSIPLDGIVIVASPQELVGLIVSKAINMANQMDIPILGLVENMSYVICPDCGKKIFVFGKSHVDEVAEKYQLPVLAKIPFDSSLAQLSDQGGIEAYNADWFDEFKLDI